ncbi:MAG TPA: kelch repeat-containing protein, partial [Thermoplasmata archaeon]|nr:kelch repeat-containing protein [Thermoplasmata archaeon]
MRRSADRKRAPPTLAALAVLLAIVVAVPAGTGHFRSGAATAPPENSQPVATSIGHPGSAALGGTSGSPSTRAAQEMLAARSTARITPATFNNSWVDISPLTPVAPPALAGAAVVYDPANGWIILFGGLSDSLGPTNYTWIFFDWTWSNITLDYPSAPSPRYYASIAYDAYLNAVVLYGGQSSVSTYLGDTWEFSPVTGWSQWHTATGLPFGPPARGGAMMAYDANDNYVLLFGGYNGSIYFGETWSWDGNNWTKLALSPSPPAREWGTLTWYPNIGALVLFGGSAYSLTTAFNDTWLFFNGNWSVTPTLIAPVDRELAGAAFDGSTHQVLLFGGEHPDGCNLQGDTWTYAAGAWQELPITGPNARWGPAMAFDPAHGYVVLFGGEIGSCSPSVGVNDTWVYGPWNTSNPP